MAAAHCCNAAVAAVNAVGKYAATNHSWPVTLDYDDCSRADDSVDAVANRKLNLQFVGLACAVAPEFDAPDFQAWSHDLYRHANLAEFQPVAHGSFAERGECENVNIVLFFQHKSNLKIGKMASPDDIDQVAFDPNQTIALNPNVTISNQLYLGQSNPRNFGNFI